MNQGFLFPDFAATGAPSGAGFAIACHEQPQQRLEHHGVHAASDTELVAAMLQGCGTTPEHAVLTASRLLVEAGSMAALLSWSPADYRRMAGVSHTKGLQFAVIAEMGRRMMSAPSSVAPVLCSPDQIVAHFAPVVAGLSVEKFWVLLLNRKNRLLRQVEVTSGTATAALAHPREVFRPALRESAPVAGIVCVHNHPSGVPEPSAQDVQVTRILREASKAVDVALLDHLILGRVDADPLGRGYFSFKAAGML
jgi:DNA repair protein RadC